MELVGNSVIVKSINKQLMLSDKTLRIVFVTNINPYYILYFLRTRNGRKQIESFSTGNQVSMRNIGQERIKQIKFPYVSSIDIQNQIVQEIERCLSVCDKVEESIVESLEKSKALRQSILKKAFEGRLLNDQELAACKSAPDYEPASRLLERIKEEKITSAKKEPVKKKK
jgi:type I restriction enzyme S subunit